jgi:hypothetical protein
MVNDEIIKIAIKTIFFMVYLLIIWLLFFKN